MSEPLERFQCQQCGAPELEPLAGDDLKCAYCGARYRRPRPAGPQEGGGRGPKVISGGNAKVVIGSKGNVVIKGGLAVKDGASLLVEGNLTLIEAGDEEKIAQRRKG